MQERDLFAQRNRLDHFDVGAGDAENRCELCRAEVEGLTTRFERCRLLSDFEGGFEGGIGNV